MRIWSNCPRTLSVLCVDGDLSRLRTLIRLAPIHIAGSPGLRWARYTRYLRTSVIQSGRLPSLLWSNRVHAFSGRLTSVRKFELDRAASIAEANFAAAIETYKFIGWDVVFATLWLDSSPMA